MHSIGPIALFDPLHNCDRGFMFTSLLPLFLSRSSDSAFKTWGNQYLVCYYNILLHSKIAHWHKFKCLLVNINESIHLCHIPDTPANPG